MVTLEVGVDNLNKGTLGKKLWALVVLSAFAYGMWRILFKPMVEFGEESRAISDKWDRIADGAAE